MAVAGPEFVVPVRAGGAVRTMQEDDNEYDKEDEEKEGEGQKVQEKMEGHLWPVMERAGTQVEDGAVMMLMAELPLAQALREETEGQVRGLEVPEGAEVEVGAQMLQMESGPGQALARMPEMLTGLGMLTIGEGTELLMMVRMMMIWMELEPPLAKFMMMKLGLGGMI